MSIENPKTLSELATRLCKADREGRTIAPCDYNGAYGRCTGCDRLRVELENCGVVMS